MLWGLAEIHSHSIFHWDLKTSNLLLDWNGILKICDFGLAWKWDPNVDWYTNLVVTLWYWAPELLLGEINYDTKVDMWSAGCILAELLLRDTLFEGKGELD